MQLSRYWFFPSYKTFSSSLFICVLKIVYPICGFIVMTYGLCQLLYYCLDGYEMRQPFKTIYTDMCVCVCVCAIKVGDYVVFLYQGSMYSRYKYIMCKREVYVNFIIYIEEKF